MNLFLDTNILIDFYDIIFKADDNIFLCNITINELENIKTSFNKSDEVKYKARQALKAIEKNEDKIKISYVDTMYLNSIVNTFRLKETPDVQIMSAVLKTNDEYPCIFLTNDLSCLTIAKTLGIKARKYQPIEVEEIYTGFKEIQLDDEEYSRLQSGKSNLLTTNRYNLKTNQYLIIKDSFGEYGDAWKWTGEELKRITDKTITSSWMQDYHARDLFQQCAINSLKNEQFTVLRGGAGTSKSLLGLTYGLHLLENQKIDRILMFVNPVATKDSCKFGFVA